MNRIRLIFTLGAVSLLFVLFAGNAALERRWRDAAEGGVPAVVLIVLTGWMTSRTFRRR
jgi:hypothetical protein